MKRLDRALQRVRIEKIAPLITPASRVLDIGCADGVLYRQVAPVASYVGIDPDAPAAASATNARFINGTFPTPLLGAEERFDVIAALAVLEHIPDDEQARFARACAQHAADGAFLVISVPSPLVDRILEVLKGLKLLDGMREEQHHGYEPRQTPSIFAPHGFRLHSHTRFELGLNHLFVLQRAN